MTRDDVLAQRAARVARLRAEQRLCAGDFLLFGDTVGAHAERCVYAARENGHPDLPACSREYDPGPPPEDEKLYEGSAIMALWEDTNESWQLAGWNVRRRTT